MKKILYALLISNLMFLGALASDADAAKKLRITIQVPLKNHLTQNLLEFKKEVEAESKGELEVEIYHSAQLYKDKEVPRAVGSGAIEMGVASLTRFSGAIPAVELFYLPFVLNSEELVKKATAPGSKVRTLIEDEIQKTGSRVLWWQAYGMAQVLSNGDVIAVPEDMDGKKVRVFGKTLGKFVESAGGVPTLISGSEQFLAYQRGIVDAGMTGLSGVKSRKLYQVMDWLTLTNHSDIEFVVLINEKFWEGLTSEEQVIITTAAQKVEVALRDRISEVEADALATARKEGMKVRELSPEEVVLWQETVTPVIESYKKDAGETGVQLLMAVEELKK
ncbi:MAG: TRAP transporter substrate-binding protein DctP [Sneathiella sp.]